MFNLSDFLISLSFLEQVLCINKIVFLISLIIFFIPYYNLHLTFYVFYL